MNQFSVLNKSGHLLLKNFLNVSEKKLITKTFFRILSKYLKIDKNFYKQNFNNAVINKKMIDFRKNNPKMFADFYDELGFPVTWEDAGKERQLEISLKSESGYFVTATLLADGNDIIIKDVWGNAQKIKATRGNLEMIKAWSEER